MEKNKCLLIIKVSQSTWLLGCPLEGIWIPFRKREFSVATNNHQDDIKNRYFVLSRINTSPSIQMVFRTSAKYEV